MIYARNNLINKKYKKRYLRKHIDSIINSVAILFHIRTRP